MRFAPPYRRKPNDNPPPTVSASPGGIKYAGPQSCLPVGNALALAPNDEAGFPPCRAPMNPCCMCARRGTGLEDVYVIQHKAMVVSLGLIALLAGCGGSSGSGTYTVTHKVGVTVSGLSGAGLELQLNGSNDLPITANGTATFPSGIASGATYAVTVLTQPTFPTQSCSVVNGSGTITTADVSGIAITCPTAVTILYSFTGGAANSSDGARPIGSLVQGGDGSLYGTTSLSGMTHGGTTPGGVAFNITLSGQETILQRGMPSSALVLGSDGNFYGATLTPNPDTVVCLYMLSPVGAESILATIAFPDGLDFRVQNDMGGVIQGKAGEFYGIASLSFDEYGVFVVASPGVYGFVSGIGSGSSSTASLVQATDGLLYGTAVGGGTYGMGTVFSVNSAATGLGKTIYSFGASPGDGLAPGVPLIQGSDGNLYGTTATGGAPSTSCPQGCGTVFKVTPAGAETVLHSFGSSPADGRGPSGALVLASDGNFYGTTASGGSTASSGSANANCSSANVYSGYSGCGTIYKITPTGIATVLYSFGGTTEDGTVPTGALLQAGDGILYGITTAGGAADEGTVFKLVLGAN